MASEQWLELALQSQPSSFLGFNPVSLHALFLLSSSGDSFFKLFIYLLWLGLPFLSVSLRQAGRCISVTYMPAMTCLRRSGNTRFCGVREFLPSFLTTHKLMLESKSNTAYYFLAYNFKAASLLTVSPVKLLERFELLSLILKVGVPDPVAIVFCSCLHTSCCFAWGFLDWDCSPLPRLEEKSKSLVAP